MDEAFGRQSGICPIGSRWCNNHIKRGYLFFHRRSSWYLPLRQTVVEQNPFLSFLSFFCLQVSVADCSSIQRSRSPPVDENNNFPYLVSPPPINANIKKRNKTGTANATEILRIEPSVHRSHLPLSKKRLSPHFHDRKRLSGCFGDSDDAWMDRSVLVSWSYQSAPPPPDQPPPASAPTSSSPPPPIRSISGCCSAV